jgi:uncharacterized protein
MKQMFVLIYSQGPAWVEGKPASQQPLGEHGDYIHSLFQQGKLVMAGPFTDDAGGLAVIEVDGAEEAGNILASDPAVTNQIMTCEMHPFVRVPWDRYEQIKARQS